MQSASTSYLSEANQLFSKFRNDPCHDNMGIFKSPKMCRLYSVYCTVEKSEILSQECDKIFRDTCQLNTLDL